MCKARRKIANRPTTRNRSKERNYIARDCRINKSKQKKSTVSQRWRKARRRERRRAKNLRKRIRKPWKDIDVESLDTTNRMQIIRPEHGKHARKFRHGQSRT